MPNETLTLLPELTAIHEADDWMYMVDKSDTSENPDGKSYKIRRSKLSTKVLLGTYPPVSGRMVMGPEFPGGILPQNYNRLRISGRVRSTNPVTLERLLVLLNEETTQNLYRYQTNNANNGSSSSYTATTEPTIGLFPGSSGSVPANSYYYFEILFQNYAGNRPKIVTAEGNGMEQNNYIRNGMWAVCPPGRPTLIAAGTNTAPITQITIQGSAWPTRALLGTMHLYGEM